MNTPNYQISAKLGGSQFDKKIPMVKCQWKFEEATDPKFFFEVVIFKLLMG